MTTSTTAPSRTKARLLTVAVATLAAVIVFLIADALLDGGVVVDSGGTTQRVSVIGVLITSIISGLAGWGLLVLLEKVTAKGGMIWTVVAGVFLLLSLFGPLGASSTGGKVTLLLLHLVVGGIVIAGFRRTFASR